MTDAMCIHLCLNQLCLGKKLKELPSLAVDFLKKEKLIDAYTGALGVKRVVVTPMERMFINLIRTPDYAFNVTKAGSPPLTLEQVATIARDNNYDPNTCAHWAVYLIHAIEDSTTGEDYVADGALYLTRKTADSKPDLEAAMKKAFSLYVWGCENPTARQMRTVHDALKLMTIDGDTVLTVKEFSALLRAFVTSQLSPRDLGEYALVLSDLSVTLKATQALCYWGDYTRTSVRIVMPRGVSNVTLVIGVLPINEFVSILASNPRAFVDVCAKGQRMVFKEKVAKIEEA